MNIREHRKEIIRARWERRGLWLVAMLSSAMALWSASHCMG